ncbi:MAG: tetratricopeptide repeat protein [Chloroflexi bacterium]|nr:tetratricopeptide repeat protein [Chloroflexota bacterium]
MKLDELCLRADLAIRLASIDYTIAVCQHILSHIPKHIQAHSLLGQALLEQGAFAKAAEQFKTVLDLDPENVLARSALGVVYEKLGQLSAAIEQFERARQIDPRNPDIADGLRQLYTQRDGEPRNGEPNNDGRAAANSLPPAAVARWHAAKKQYTLAVKELDDVIGAQPNRTEFHLARAEALWRAGLLREAERASIQVLQKASNTVKAKLILAEIMTRDRTREKQGLALLHEALGLDPGGRLVRDLFKDTSFVVPDLGNELDLPPLNGSMATPPEVEAAIALLPKGATDEAGLGPAAIDDLELEEVTDVATPKALATPDILRIQSELERIGGALSPGEGRRVQTPQRAAVATTELILTSKKRIVAQYGQDAFDRLDRKLQDFARTLEFSDIDAKIVYVDDEASVEQYGIGTADPDRPEQIKAVIDGLEESLKQTGRQLDHILIVGGDTIIPFFRLTNPAQDDDENVPSDNPYASRDADFLIPERALGRMPDVGEAGISFLMAQLETAMAHRHARSSPAQPLGCLAVLASLGVGVKLPKLQRSSFGYSALVWRDASARVFEAIGSPTKLLTSPPITEELFDISWLLGSSFNYFNLHGAKDSEYWYGQKDLTYPEDYPMLPIALSPATIARSSVASSVVFTEACYGAGILGRNPVNSLALRFLADGALGFVGSTVTSYGVPAPPLSAADVLAVHFWHHLADGLSLGEALTRAKITFMDETIARQGWLDGDDQKTLLEFVLYGDPSSHLDKAPEPKPKAAYRPAALPKRATHSRPHLWCRHRMSAKDDGEMPVNLIHKVVSHLHTCCPEMHGASVRIHSCVSCNGQCGARCQCGASGLHSHGLEIPRKVTLFTSRKALQTADGRQVPRIARATVDTAGDIIKTTVSR